MNYWRDIKIGIITFALITVLLQPSSPSEPLEITFLEAIAIFAILPLSITVALFILGVIFKKKLAWDMPLWSSNPFNFEKPQGLLHLEAIVMLTTGTVNLTKACIINKSLQLANLLPIILSLSFLLTLWILSCFAKWQSRNH